MSAHKKLVCSNLYPFTEVSHVLISFPSKGIEFVSSTHPCLISPNREVSIALFGEQVANSHLIPLFKCLRPLSLARN